MGISSQRDITWKSKKVDFDHVVFLVKDVHRQRQQKKLTTRSRPKISIDASLLGFRFIGSTFKPSTAVKIIASSLAEKGIDVVINFDGPNRHHSKRASCARRAATDTAQIDRLNCRNMLVPLINEPNPTPDIEEQKKELSKKLRSLEAKTDRVLPTDFVQDLKSWHQQYKPDGRGCIFAKDAPWQADPCIAKGAIDGAIDAVLSGDSDFQMYVGNGGPDGLGDLMLRNPYIRSRTNRVETVEIQTGQLAVKTYVETCLRRKRGDEDLWQSLPRYPLFDGLADSMLRAVVAVSMGSDVNPGGVDGLGPSKMATFLAKAKEKDSSSSSGESDVVDSLLGYVCDFATARKARRGGWKGVSEKSALTKHGIVFAL